MFEEPKEQLPKELAVEFKGKEGDSLSPESADEFYKIIEGWKKFDNPIEQLDGWCDHYYGRKHVPVNFALKLWEEVEHTDEVWSFVEKVFEDCKGDLDQHGASLETIEDIKKRLTNE